LNAPSDAGGAALAAASFDFSLSYLAVAL